MQVHTCCDVGAGTYPKPEVMQVHTQLMWMHTRSDAGAYPIDVDAYLLGAEIVTLEFEIVF